MGKMMIRSIQTQPVISPKARPNHLNNQNNNNFSAHLQTAMHPDGKLVISKHAKERLNQRGIQIDSAEWKSIEGKIQEAKQMGVKESLVLLKDAALIVSAKNNTVITAMDRAEAGTQIFTNINGTIILDQ